MTTLDWIMYVLGTWCILGHLACWCSGIRDKWYLKPFMVTVLGPIMLFGWIWGYVKRL